jgi:hypothetical protein
VGRKNFDTKVTNSYNLGKGLGKGFSRRRMQGLRF